MSYLYVSMAVVDPLTMTAVANANLQAYAPADTGHTTPLVVTDPTGVTLAAVKSNHLALSEPFISDLPIVVLSDGVYSVPVASPQGMLDAALAAQAAAEAIRSTSVRSVNGEFPVEGDVEIEVSGVDDTGLADLIETPASATALALTSIYGPGALFLDLDDPVPPGTPDGTLIYRTAGGGTPPPVPVVYMTDDFERTVAAGSVGTPSGGGTYAAIDIAADWSVGSGAGIWKAPAAGARSGYLRSSTYNQDTVEIVGMISQVTGAVGNRIFTIAPRRIAASSVQYGANIVLRGSTATRPLQVDLGLQKGATEGDLQATVAGVLTTGALGALVRFRMRVIQVDPATTQVQARVWLDGTTEPTTWQRDATDTTAALQGAGTLFIAVRQNSGETIGSEARIHEYTVQSVV